MSESKTETKLSALEFRVWRRLQAQTAELAGTKVLLACSGGMDSVALAHVLAKISKRLGFTVALAHVHHGPSAKNEITRARTLAEKAVRELSQQLDLEFFSRRFVPTEVEAELRSEAELRKFRLGSLKEMARDNQCHRLAFAHHQDDLLETRLLRLVRGTSADGLKAMREFSPKVLRPFLSVKRTEIRAYAEQKKMKWCEDPTNSDLHPLRNWVRHVWLPMLEEKKTGGVAALSRSLEEISERVGLEAAGDESSSATSTAPLNLISLKLLSPSRKRQTIASYLRNQGVRDFSTTHLNEVLKRIESAAPRRRRSTEFQLLKLNWSINARLETIEAEALLAQDPNQDDN